MGLRLSVAFVTNTGLDRDLFHGPDGPRIGLFDPRTEGVGGRWDDMFSWLPPVAAAFGIVVFGTIAPLASSTPARTSAGILAAVSLGAAVAVGAGIGWVIRRRNHDRSGGTFFQRGERAFGVADLLETSNRMEAADDETEVQRIAVMEAMRLVDADAGAFVTTGPNGLLVSQATASGLFRTDPINSGVVVQVMQNEQSMHTIVQIDPALTKANHAVAIAPVHVRGRIAGTILVVRNPEFSFVDSDVEILCSLAPVTGAALAAVRARSLSTASADVDGLTKLKNRRRLDRDLATIGTEPNVAFAMIDIDHFEHFTDTNGHHVSELALQAVAEAIAGCVRSTDVVYRFGGEEFGILMPHTSSDEAEVVMERVRRTIEVSAIPGREQQPLGRMTVSVGVVADATTSGHRLPNQAGEALDRAKRQGRNRVVAVGDAESRLR